MTPVFYNKDVIRNKANHSKNQKKKKKERLKMIKIDEKYYITADAMCYTVSKIKHNKVKNTDTFVPVSYHRTLEECLYKIINVKEREYIANNSADIDTALKHFRELLEEYKDIFDKIDPEKLNINAIQNEGDNEASDDTADENSEAE